VSLPKSNYLTFNLHYTPYGEETNDHPVLALWYHRTKPAKVWQSGAGVVNDFSIPPGAADYSVASNDLDLTYPSPVRLHRLNPHMHLRGKRMRYTAYYPNGKSEILLSVPDYDFNWQLGYEFAEPKLLPAGTYIIADGAFDNSPQNPSNPDPTATVTWGDQSSMEMFSAFVEHSE
jgi:hypothetical protein